MSSPYIIYPRHTGVTGVKSEVSVKSNFRGRDSISLLKGGNVVEERVREWDSDCGAYGGIQFDKNQQNHVEREPRPLKVAPGAPSDTSDSVKAQPLPTPYDALRDYMKASNKEQSNGKYIIKV